MPDLQRLLTRPTLNRTVGTLTLPPGLLAAIFAEGWSKWPNETGGILLDHRTPTHPPASADLGAHLGAVVAQVVGPGPNARHDRYGFEPDADWQAAQVAAAWAGDNTLEYLGDWHTHPGGTTRFSALDHATAMTIAQTASARQPHPIMLVAALQTDLTSRVAAAVLHNSRLRTLRPELTVSESQ